MPGLDAPTTPVGVTNPNPAAVTVHTNAASPQLLRLRLTDVPGWHATLDGKALVLSPYAGIMMQARIPAGRHVIELHYWPTAFAAGIGLALVSAVALCGVSVAAFLVPRRRRQPV